LKEEALLREKEKWRGEAGAVTPSRAGPPARTCFQSDSCRAPTVCCAVSTRSVTFFPSALTKRVRTFILSTRAFRVMRLLLIPELVQRKTCGYRQRRCAVLKELLFLTPPPSKLPYLLKVNLSAASHGRMPFQGLFSFTTMAQELWQTLYRDADLVLEELSRMMLSESKFACFAPFATLLVPAQRLTARQSKRLSDGLSQEEEASPARSARKREKHQGAARNGL